MNDWPLCPFVCFLICLVRFCVHMLSKLSLPLWQSVRLLVCFLTCASMRCVHVPFTQTTSQEFVGAVVRPDWKAPTIFAAGLKPIKHLADQHLCWWKLVGKGLPMWLTCVTLPHLKQQPFTQEPCTSRARVPRGQTFLRDFLTSQPQVLLVPWIFTRVAFGNYFVQHCAAVRHTCRVVDAEIVFSDLLAPWRFKIRMQKSHFLKKAQNSRTLA